MLTPSRVIHDILEGWYQPPEEKFNDRGEKFMWEAIEILHRFVEEQTAIAHAEGVKDGAFQCAHEKRIK